MRIIEPSLFEEQMPNTYNTIDEICTSIGCEYGVPGWPDKFGAALFSYINKNRLPKIRTLSLFSGAGGLDIGFHDLGFDIVESVEIEPKFCNTLFLNSGKGNKFENSKPNCIDIKDYTGDNLGEIDFIIGGPPCQTFSAAGRRHGGVLGTTDARGVLFREYVRLLKKLKPKGFLFENVYGIIGAQNGEPWKEIKKSFSEVGYKLYYRILDAADYGVPQHRERLIIVGLKDGLFEFPRPTNGVDSINDAPFYNAGTAISGLVLSEEEKAVGISGRFGKLIIDIPPGLNYSFYTKELGHPSPIFAWRSKFSDFMYKADPDMPVRTIKAQGGQYTGPLHWESRYFALSEYKRLQTFPDDYVISGNKQVAIHQIGNSVPPQLARMMAIAIRSQVFDTVFPFNISYLAENEQLSFRKNKNKLTDYYRNKATNALKKMSFINQITAYRKSYDVSLTPKFQLVVSEQGGDYNICVNWGKDLRITVQPFANREIEPVIVEISPTEDWSLSIKTVKLIIYSSNWFSSTVAWRVFEKELQDNHLKADLVQLNGYYQYESRIKCSLFCGEIAGSRIMKSIYSGIVVGKNITTTILAESWGIKEADVLNKALLLREYGYDIRNNHTNPQIPEGIWLIPYKFPSLLPESVQLNKSLF